MTNSEEMIYVEAKSRFEEIGAALQFSVRNMHQAVKRYEDSCRLCTMKHRCTGKVCTIQRAFEHNINKYHEQIMRNPDLQADIMDVLITD